MEAFLAFLATYAPLFQFLGFVSLILLVIVSWQTDRRLLHMQAQISLLGVNLTNHIQMDDASFRRSGRRLENLEKKVFNMP